jgi:hypothetical protein
MHWRQIAPRIHVREGMKSIHARETARVLSLTAGSQETFFDTWWLSGFGTDHASAGIASNGIGIWTIDGRWTKMTLLCAHGENQSVTQAPQTILMRVVLRRDPSADPWFWEWNSMASIGVVTRHVLRLVLYPRSWRRSISSPKRGAVKLPSWARNVRTVCCSQKMRYEACDTVGAPPNVLKNPRELHAKR